MNPQTLNLRVDSVDDEHVYCTLFINDAMLGTLTFYVGEYQIFATTLLLGVEHTHGHLVDESDDSVFIAWARHGE